ncbi:RND family efflux transporter, MFP subunit [Pseudarcicella hirudinis]|uniref:RND family efflux transporter, MFP subunit n=1 Tax=Pseudarcicella hirudinis TaxID=1079859 RepID=A0A1I5LY43_9BACT|nr:efflux RND transporter periplasmic adaptor subunit [Pseudarcicella hirudinis]SFP02304.1 RND family efflux transporter, MFP subunit [Pseudarcicella hirudinis]
MATIVRTFTPVLAIATLFLSSCGSKKEQIREEEKTVKVSVKQITPAGQPEAFSYSGTIEADNSVALGFSVSGRVTAVSVQEGQHVRAGQLLATLETTEYENALLVAKASLEQAEDLFKRYNELHSKGSLPERDFISAKVSLAQAEANKSSAVKRLADTKLYAPFTGIISAKQIEKGASAAPGLTAFTILKTDQVYAQASVPESEIGKLSIGKDAVINIPVLSETLRGKINIINPQGDQTTKTFTVKVRIGNNGGKLLPGMISDIKISTGKTVDAISVPAESVVRDADNITYVFIVNDQNKAIRKRIATGGLSADGILITNGLQSGDKVVVAGQTKIKDGQTVSL